MYSNLLKNQIYINDTGFCCNECTFNGDLESANLHIETTEHKIRMKYAMLYKHVMNPLEDIEISESESEILVQNRVIFKNPTYLRCSTCKLIIRNLKSAVKHIANNSHVDILKNGHKPGKKRSKCSKKEDDKEDGEEEEEEEEDEDEEEEEEEDIQLEYYSPFTHLISEFGSRYSKLCLEHGPENIYNPDYEFMYGLELGIDVTFLHRGKRNVRCCIPCNIKFPDNGQILFEHLQSPKHSKNFLAFQGTLTRYGRFSKLDFAKSFMMETKHFIDCSACVMRIQNEPKVILQHIYSTQHQMNCQQIRHQNQQIFYGYRSIFENAWYYIQVYYCTICCKVYQLELKFVEHLESKNHKRKVKNSLEKNLLKYMFCIPCAKVFLLYKSTCIYDSHYRSRGHITNVRKGNYEVQRIPGLLIYSLDHLEENVAELEELSDKVTFSKQEKELQILKYIENEVKSIYPKAMAHLFGSRISYMGFPDSDLDVYLDCENGYDGNTTPEQRREFLLSAVQCFKNATDTWEIEKVLMRTRIPIITLLHKPSGLKCDISFTGGLSVEKSKIVRSINSAFRPCRQMILFLKKWLHLSTLSITSFAIAWFVIFFLQHKGILPSIVRLIELKNESKLINGWEIGISEEIPVVESDNFTIKDLLRDFFKFYFQFDFKTYVVCPYMGQIVEKRAFASIDDLPAEMNSYKERVKVKDIETFQISSPMCIQDPVDLTQNMTKAISKIQLRTFIQYCRLSAERLSR